MTATDFIKEFALLATAHLGDVRRGVSYKKHDALSVQESAQ